MATITIPDSTYRNLQTEAESLNLSIEELAIRLLATVPQKQDESGDLEVRFRELTNQWKSETKVLSSTTDKAMHPAYQTIIGMGRPALPLILNDLQNNSGHWYWALHAISGEDPVPPTDRGSIAKMKSSWLNWGRIKGYLA
jgi:HAMP domain-containing protein